MKWRSHISECFPDAKFVDPAPWEAVRNIETKLSITLPDDLKELYAETNGFLGYIGSSIVWTADEVLSRNLEMRSGYADLYMPFDCLLLFGEDGGGDFFGFRILSTGVEEWQTFRWVHETDSRIWYSGGLRDYIQRFGNTYYPKNENGA